MDFFQMGGGVEAVFAVIAWVSSILLILQMVASWFGGFGGHDLGDGGLDLGHGDLSHGFDHGDFSHGGAEHPDGVGHAGPGVISVRTVLAFLVGFGWAGVILLRSGVVLFLAILGAALVGVIFLLVVFWLAVQIYRLSESGTIDSRNALGQSGTVYLPIPAKGQGKGQVQVVVQNRLRELPAVTDEEAPLPTGTRIQVVKVLDDGSMLVRRI